MAQSDQLNGIIAFVESATLLSFTAAADKLGITKSAVGKSVAKLEERLGTKLVHRTTRKLTLTTDGEAYLASCRHALEEIGAAESALVARNQKLAGRLRIDAPAAWGRQILLPILARIVKQHPGLSLSLSLTDRIIDPVEEGVDLTIRFGGTSSTSGLIMRKLAEQNVLIVASPDYLKARGIPSSVADLQHHDCIVGFRRDIPNTWRVKAVDGSITYINPPATHEIGDGAAIVEAALAGLGLAQMPSSLLARHLREGRLVPVLQEVAGATVEISAIWPATKHLLPRVRHVVDLLAAEGRAGALGI
ncbi:LysR family transcriptional regulator (plasmid) [Agrobacterium leguminum]|uniref:HTH-type transcriptional regulator TtuA n=1 Tax=Agrobacterium deltaense NCPPB 1641 TaxID=1183425 RepID=A0A1S7U9D2_9HYPH|nr:MULTISPECIES: LysR family transcriptional regulator [Agrobacterium]WFS70088.1 LysR family transcriptional regulator [Agrobacterium leguminum]CVI63473.1 Transcriptional regulator, LysR family [Agrobacterium deltaense NCPPB 1641]